jgi:hypothetical protein
MSVTILTGLLKIVHSYRHETVTEYYFHIAAMLLLYILPKYTFTKMSILFTNLLTFIFSVR